MIRILMKHNLTFPILICFYLVLMGFAWAHSANADEGRKSTIQEPEKETDESALFRQICIHHRPSFWTGGSGRGGDVESMNCQADDGGNVGVSIADRKGTVTIHQTKQMDGSFIKSLLDALDVERYIGSTTSSPRFYLNGDAITPKTEEARYKCAAKVKQAQSTGKYGDMSIMFVPGTYLVTCHNKLNATSRR